MENLMRPLFLTTAICMALGSASNAQFLTEENITLLGRTAEIVCGGYETSGSSSVVTLSAEAEAEAKALLRILRGDVEVDVDTIVSKYQNVPRSDLTDIVKFSQRCKLDVFKSLRDDFSKVGASLAPQTGSLIWAFSHSIKDGVALGIINVRAGGKGVDVNFRVRNLREEPVFVKFGLPSYTDETGNVCQGDSLTTSVKGVSRRSNEPPTQILPGDSLQFSASNVRCDSNTFGSTGDIVQRALVGTSTESLQLMSFEVAAVQTLKN